MVETWQGRLWGRKTKDWNTCLWTLGSLNMGELVNTTVEMLKGHRLHYQNGLPTACLELGFPCWLQEAVHTSKQPFSFFLWKTDPIHKLLLSVMVEMEWKGTISHLFTTSSVWTNRVISSHLYICVCSYSVCIYILIYTYILICTYIYGR